MPGEKEVVFFGAGSYVKTIFADISIKFKPVAFCDNNALGKK